MDEPSLPGEGVGGGYSDIFIYMLAWPIFGGFKILNFRIFGGFQKNEYFWGYEEIVDIFGGSFLNILGLFLKVKI